MVPENERYSRQKDLVPPEKLAACRATVIGVGAVGRQVALQLTAMGIPSLQLIDFDTVEISNLASQGYLDGDLGHPKVQATAEMCLRMRADVKVETLLGRFGRSMEIGDAVFCCVDKIDVRQFIWNALKLKAIPFFVDGRMSAEVLRVITACDEPSRDHYPQTFFRAEEAYAGSCTAKTTIYCANIAAGMMVAQFAKWLRGLPVDADIQMNLLTSEMSVSE